MSREKPTVIDLFCGAGGMSEGFKMAGFEIVLGIESDPMVAATYKLNNPKTATIVKDIKGVSAHEIVKAIENRKINGVIGGPPCQGFSFANTKRLKKDERNSLYEEFVRIVKILEPDFFVMENVRGMLSARTKSGGSVIEEIQETLKSNYSLDYRILLAADYGIPQLRKRLFVVGRKGDGEIPFPEKTHAPPLQNERNNGLKNWVPVRKLLIPRKNVPKKLFYSNRMISGFKRRERLNRKKGFGFRWQFLDFDRPSYTIPARYYKDGANALVKYSDHEIRMLDWEECARIQSFPREYTFIGSRKEKYKQIGNAVPPLMAYSVAKVIKEECIGRMSDANE